jgi:broad specificity phosphatase PhoE
MTQLWLARHGQTDWNLQNRWQGQSHKAPPLNANGVQQAEALALELFGMHFDAFFSSDILRARQTADILAAKIGIRYQVDARLREIHQGVFEGEHVSDIPRLYPHAWLMRDRDPNNFRADGGESACEVGARMCHFADDVTRRFPTGNVLVVSHGFALATLICKSQGLPFGRAGQHILDNARAHVLTW